MNSSVLYCSKVDRGVRWRGAMRASSELDNFVGMLCVLNTFKA